MKTFNTTNKKITSNVLFNNLTKNGTFVTIGFIKKNGETRFLNGRVGVKKYLKGGNKTATNPKYVTLFDVQDMQYKNVNLETIFSINGKKLKIQIASK